VRVIRGACATIPEQVAPSHSPAGRCVATLGREGRDRTGKETAE
jgi:hypothetical protein